MTIRMVALILCRYSGRMAWSGFAWTRTSSTTGTSPGRVKSQQSGMSCMSMLWNTAGSDHGQRRLRSVIAPGSSSWLPRNCSAGWPALGFDLDAMPESDIVLDLGRRRLGRWIEPGRIRVGFAFDGDGEVPGLTLP